MTGDQPGLAGREGFEPSEERLIPLTRLAGGRFRPLSHLPAEGVEYTQATFARQSGRRGRGYAGRARSDAGVVDRSGLENRKGRQALGGSNPSRSACAREYTGLRSVAPAR
jgi:hypothetical protein